MSTHTGTTNNNYVQQMIDRIRQETDGLDDHLAGLYALLAFTKGTATTLKDVHDAWAIWRNMTQPDHPALIPFDKLAPDVQELDREYRDGIHRAGGTP
jgi:hypothetical protein